MFGPSFFVRYFAIFSFEIIWLRKRKLLFFFNCLLGVVWLLVVCVSIPRGSTLISLCISRLGPFLGVQNSEYEYFFGMEILWIFFWVIAKLDCLGGHFYVMSFFIRSWYQMSGMPDISSILGVET